MTPVEVKLELQNHGISISEWARLAGFSGNLVHAVLNGRNKASRGESHRIAVALGLKPAPAMNNCATFIKSALMKKMNATSNLVMQEEGIAHM